MTMNALDQSVNLSQIAALLKTTSEIIRLGATTLPDALLRWRPSPGQWCINEVVGHLIEADQRGFDGRIRRILAAERPSLQAWDQDAVAAGRHDNQRELSELVDALAAGREQSVELVTQLRPEQLNRVGIHPHVSELRVSDLLHEWVHHDQNHIKQILSNIQAFVWPHMGNAQHFDSLEKRTDHSNVTSI